MAITPGSAATSAAPPALKEQPSMIVRIWRTRIDQARAGEYRDFAHSRSLPMFRAQPGFAGALFTARRAERAVITLWRDLASAQALGHSSAYQATVAEIEATGFLQGR